MISKGECCLLALSLIAIILIIPEDVKAENIETESVLEFELIYPSQFEYVTGVYISITASLNGENEELNGSIIQYRTSTSGGDEFNDWIGSEIWKNRGVQYIFCRVYLGNGKENIIQYRLQEDNVSRVLSDRYTIWIDAHCPRYLLISPADIDEFQIEPVQNIQVHIDDAESGVDADTIMYRFTTTGTDNFSYWIPYRDAQSGNTVLVNLKLTFSRGDENFVQVRARDIIGNPLKASPEYNIKINTFPIINISSPTGGEILYSDVPVLFDATYSFDPDGDFISFKWYKSGPEGMELFGITALLTERFAPGGHPIRLIITDSVDNDAFFSFIILVEKSPVIDPEEPINYLLRDPDADPDDDGFTNLQEYCNCTDPLNPYSRPNYDLDQDGINDIWEMMNKLDFRDPSDAEEDPDHDGYTNFEEYKGDTDPNDLLSAPGSVNPLRTIWYGSGAYEHGLFLLSLIFFIRAIFIMGYVYWMIRDMKRRGMDGVRSYLISLIFFGIIVLIMYRFKRRKGNMINCVVCGNERLEELKTGPHCNCLVKIKKVKKPMLRLKVLKRKKKIIYL